MIETAVTNPISTLLLGIGTLIEHLFKLKLPETQNLLCVSGSFIMKLNLYGHAVL